MDEKLYLYDPNQYIQSLSLIKRSIEKQIQPELKNHSNLVDKKLSKQIINNFMKYKKQTLQKQRIKLAKEHYNAIQDMKKQNLEQLIENKIKNSEVKRQNKKRQSIQNKRVERLLKQQIVKSKLNQIKKQKAQKSLQLLQKIEQKSNSSIQLPLKLRVLEEQIRQSLLKKQSQIRKNELPYQSSSIKRTNSLLLLPKINQRHDTELSKQNTQLSISIGNNRFAVSEFLSKNQNHSQMTSEQIVQNLSKQLNGKRSESFSHLKPKTFRSNDNDQEIVDKIIEEKRSARFSEWVQKNSIAYQAMNHSGHKEIKKAMQSYLKEHIKQLNEINLSNFLKQRQKVLNIKIKQSLND